MLRPLPVPNLDGIALSAPVLVLRLPVVAPRSSYGAVQALYDTFSLFGNILSCKVATDEAGESKGYGYVHYETGVSANMAITKINGMLIAGKQVRG